MANTIVWADIPVTDLARARKFYSAILQVEIEAMPGFENAIALLPELGEKTGGIVVSADLATMPDRQPGDQSGPIIYLNGEPDAQLVLDRVEAAGGKVLQNKQFMGEMVGAIGFFLDTEGNRIGVQSRQ